MPAAVTQVLQEHGASVALARRGVQWVGRLSVQALLSGQKCLTLFCLCCTCWKLPGECRPFHTALFNTSLVVPELAEAYLRSQAHLISVSSVLEFSVIYSVRKYWHRLSSQNFGMLMTVT